MSDSKAKDDKVKVEGHGKNVAEPEKVAKEEAQKAADRNPKTHKMAADKRSGPAQGTRRHQEDVEGSGPHPT